MASYSVFVTRPARKELAEVPSLHRERIVARIGALATDPRPSGRERLSLQEKHRVRQGEYRIVCMIREAAVTVLAIKIGHRRDVYRKP
jgi:mRNA interferase RelE/StbE